MVFFSRESEAMTLRKCNFFVLVCFFMLKLYATAKTPLSHKIVFLISIPRSMSTATLRAIHNRGDFIVVNEPAVATFFGLSDEGTGDDWEYQKDRSQLTYREIIDHIIEHSAKSHVFVKEMQNSTRIMKNLLL